LQRTDLNAGEESWLRMIGHQFRANADHYVGDDAEFALDQFAFHPFSQLGGLAQAVRVFGREERLAQVIGSLNEHMFGGAADDHAAGTPRPASAPPPATH
jgi:type I restriction enzyme, R subunit